MGVKEVLRAAWARPWAPYAVALLLQLALAPWFVHDWDGFVFLRSAQDLLAGVTPYETAEAAPSHIFLDDHWPPVNTWYAYPPLMLVLFTPLVGLAQAVSGDPAVWRLALKLPFIAGNLLLAYVGGRLVERLAKADGPTLRRRTEVLLLLNPFLVFVAAAWGMFDAAMMALLLLSLLLLHERRHALGGLAFGLATLVKVFPLFVAPLFAVHAWRAHGRAAALRFVGAAVGVASLACLPFFLASPRGFLNQVLLMHLERGPQGFALVSFPLQLRNLNNVFGWDIPIAPEGVVLAAAGAILWTSFLLVWSLAPRAKDTLGLLRLCLVAFLTLLLVNKVVNEQYFVMPLALLTVLLALDPSPRLLRAHRAYTWGGLVSGVLIGLHFLTFLPSDVVRLRPDDVVGSVAAATGIPVLLVFSIPHAVAILALVPALVATVALVAGPLREAVADLARGLARVGGRVALPAANALVVALLLLPPVASTVLALPPPAGEPSPLPSEGLVFARYDLSVVNPAHDPWTREGFWAEGPYPPTLQGYYHTTPHKVAQDLALLKEAGVDVVIAGHRLQNGVRFETFLGAVEAAGLRAAPSLDVGSLRACPDAQRLRPAEVPADGPTPADATAAELAALCVRSALRPFRDHPAAFRLEGEPVLFVLNVTDLPAEWADEALVRPSRGARLVASVEPGAPAPLPWAHATFVQAPRSRDLDAFRAATRDLLAEGSGPRVAAAFPATWSAAGEETYRVTWEDALAGGAEWVVVPWNLHREGGALEPRLTDSTHRLPMTAAYAKTLEERAWT